MEAETDKIHALLVVPAKICLGLTFPYYIHVPALPSRPESHSDIVQPFMPRRCKVKHFSLPLQSFLQKV